jgi:hypothetical protein
MVTSLSSLFPGAALGNRLEFLTPAASTSSVVCLASTSGSRQESNPVRYRQDV